MILSEAAWTQDAVGASVSPTETRTDGRALWVRRLDPDSVSSNKNFLNHHYRTGLGCSKGKIGIICFAGIFGRFERRKAGPRGFRMRRPRQRVRLL